MTTARWWPPSRTRPPRTAELPRDTGWSTSQRAWYSNPQLQKLGGRAAYTPAGIGAAGSDPWNRDDPAVAEKRSAIYAACERAAAAGAAQSADRAPSNCVPAFKLMYDTPVPELQARKTGLADSKADLRLGGGERTGSGRGGVARLTTSLCKGPRRTQRRPRPLWGVPCHRCRKTGDRMRSTTLTS
jgi:hypothetical protein